MPDPVPPGTDKLAQAFRGGLRQCAELYRECAEAYTHAHPELMHDSPDAFVQRMLNLHRGLVTKVFVEMVTAGSSPGEGKLKLAQDLFEHAWDRRLTQEQAREALMHYVETTHVRWENLLSPFERLSTFRKHKAELQELILRLADLVSRADGEPEEREACQVQWIDSELRRILQEIPVVEDEMAILKPATLPASQPMTRGNKQEAVQVLPAGDLALRDDDGEVQNQPAYASAGRSTSGRDSEHLATVLAELDSLIGLANVKQEVRELVNFLQMEAERRKHGLPQTPMSLHSVYSGNPGTGKTTVARLFGRILGAMGILARGHLVETDRSGLVAEYSGQTATKTLQRIEESLDGVLFIDEAYSLVAERGEDAYGHEALQVLLKQMEDRRHRLVVILAGYPSQIDRLLKTNPGLTSRFSHTLSFPDYTASELGQIFESLCLRDRYNLPARTRARLLLGFDCLLRDRNETFGNGRIARNVFEQSVRRLASRLAGVRPLTRKLLTTLEPEDIVLKGVPESTWSQLDLEALLFRLSCPCCSRPHRLPPHLLGYQVECTHCGRAFAADWAEVVLQEKLP